MLRYFIDERVGCIAVRDRKNTDPYYSGLHEDTRGVIKFWMGKTIEKGCSLCGHFYVDWDGISQEDVEEARQLCDKLNRKGKKGE